MTGDEIVKTLFGVALAGVTAIVGWLVKTVWGNREGVLLLGGKVDELTKTKVTKEDIRLIVEEVISKWDDLNNERQVQWSKTLALEIKQAVLDGTNQCRSATSDIRKLEMRETAKHAVLKTTAEVVKEVLRQQREQPDGV